MIFVPLDIANIRERGGKANRRIHNNFKPKRQNTRTLAETRDTTNVDTPSEQGVELM